MKKYRKQIQHIRKYRSGRWTYVNKGIRYKTFKNSKIDQCLSLDNKHRKTIIINNEAVLNIDNVDGQIVLSGTGWREG